MEQNFRKIEFYKHLNCLEVALYRFLHDKKVCKFPHDFDKFNTNAITMCVYFYFTVLSETNAFLIPLFFGQNFARGHLFTFLLGFSSYLFCSCITDYHTQSNKLKQKYGGIGETLLKRHEKVKCVCGRARRVPGDRYFNIYYSVTFCRSVIVVFLVCCSGQYLIRIIFFYFLKAKGK